jgi:hypothetical protein
MDLTLLLSNLANPPVLFFFLGMLAVLVRSDLDIPQPTPKLLALYLLLAIGFKGGVELHKSGLDAGVMVTLGVALLVAVAVPVWIFFAMRRRMGVPNAAAVAATYGSVSAVTFIAGTSLLAHLAIPFSGWMVAAMALMESPAIIVGVVLARRYATDLNEAIDWRELLREAFFNGSVFVLMGSLVIGAITGASGEAALAPFTGGIFKGVLCLFLLDMGLVSARRLAASRELRALHVGFAAVVPLLHAVVGIGISVMLGLSRGDALLFTVLCASASYIAVPAAMRLAVPQASPGVYVPMALALTFPFNVIIGLPLYLAVINRLWS